MDVEVLEVDEGGQPHPRWVGSENSVSATRRPSETVTISASTSSATLRMI